MNVHAVIILIYLRNTSLFRDHAHIRYKCSAKYRICEVVMISEMSRLVYAHGDARLLMLPSSAKLARRRQLPSNGPLEATTVELNIN